jgi:hypothetical protein
VRRPSASAEARHGADRTGGVETAGKDVTQPFAPELQRGIEHVEGGDGEEVPIERDLGRAPEAAVQAEQNGDRDQRTGHRQRDAQPEHWMAGGRRRRRRHGWLGVEGCLEGLRELRAVDEAVGGRARQGLGDDLLDRLRHVAERVQGRDRLGQAAGDDRLWRATGERRLTSEHLVKDAAKGIDVAPAIELPVAARLLRAHVQRGAERDAGLGQPLAAGRVERSGDSEVREDTMAAREQDVLRFDVAVNETLPVGIAQGIGDLERDPGGVSQRELRLARQALPQRLARDVWHREPQGLHRTARRRRGPAIEDGQDMGMLQTGGGLDLPHKALGAERMGQLLMQDLEGDRPIVPNVARQVHRGHPTAPELTLEQVAVTKSIAQGRVADSHENCLDGRTGMCSQHKGNARKSAVHANAEYRRCAGAGQAREGRRPRRMTVGVVLGSRSGGERTRRDGAPSPELPRRPRSPPWPRRVGLPARPAGVPASGPYDGSER